MAKKILSCILLSLSVTSFAQENELSNQMSAINSKINQIKQNIISENKQEDKLTLELRSIEMAADDISKNLYELDKKIKQQTQTIHFLIEEQKREEAELARSENLMSQELRTVYLLGKNSALKILMSDQSMTEVSRQTYYLRYLNQARFKKMQEMQITLNQLIQTKENLSKENLALQNLKNQAINKDQQLKSLYIQRQNLLQTLHSDITQNKNLLSQLTQDKRRLSDLVSNLQTEENNFIQPPLPFAQMKGKLPWPVKGKIIENFGHPIESSEVLTTGVLIAANNGQKVSAVYPGKVLFADWLKGFGLLMIIDQGNGYMTLYGHNQSLFKKVGETVNAGEVIAQVGESGGFAQNGLYFEIRDHNMPQDPQDWCEKQTT